LAGLARARGLFVDGIDGPENLASKHSMTKEIAPALSAEALSGKSRAYIARALAAKGRNDMGEYQLWASLALELLGKSALAGIHPCLVADRVYRERVYCYELYHQMRLHWPTRCPFYLNGEIDKSAHPILTQLGASYAKPDLLVHQPGYMKGNHAIIEVKSSRAVSAGITKDLNTLSVFINNVGYQRAIYLLYGHEIDERLIGKIERLARLPRLFVL
jgi:hypothetical protein